jgi:hypothetical protein
MNKMEKEPNMLFPRSKAAFLAVYINSHADLQTHRSGARCRGASVPVPLICAVNLA